MNPFFGTVGFSPFTNSFGQCFPGCCPPAGTMNAWNNIPAWAAGNWNPAFNQTPWANTNAWWNWAPTLGWNNTMPFNGYAPWSGSAPANTWWNNTPANAWNPVNTWNTNPFFFNQFQPFPGSPNSNTPFNTNNFAPTATQNGTANPSLNGSCTPTGTIPTNLNNQFNVPNTLGFFGTSFFNPFGFPTPAQFAPNGVVPLGNFQPVNFGFQPGFMPGMVTPNFSVGIPSAAGYVTPSNPIDGADQQTQKRSMARGVA